MKLVKRELKSEELVLEETLFHVANGYFGVRGNFEEGVPPGIVTIRGCYINGYYDDVPLQYSEKLYGFPDTAQRMVNLPDVQTMRLRINGEEFSLFSGELLNYERTLDTDEGIARRHMRWRSPAGTEATVTITRMASFVRPELFLTVYSVQAPPGTQLEIDSEVNCDVSNFADSSDPRVASERWPHIFFDGADLIDETTGIARCHTTASGLSLAICQRHRLAGHGSVEVAETSDGFATHIKTLVPQEGQVTVEKYTLFSDGRRHENPAEHLVKVVNSCCTDGAEILLREQKEYLDAFWSSSRVVIEGDPALAEGMEFNLYELLQSAGRDGISNVSAKGLSGEGYEGHYFWDTEIYILPFFLFTHPHLARRLIDFRYSVLDAARRHACIMGHKKGALYPWRTISGSECSSYFPSGSAQYHITGDVAYSFLQYYYATGDLNYMAEKGAEVLLETARLWVEAGNYNSSGAFCIHDITGPDEYTCVVNNNYYTNMCAKNNLLGAIEVYEELKKRGMHTALQQKIAFEEEELEAFRRAAEKMRLPFDAKQGIHAQDDSFLNKPMWDFEGVPKENYPLLLHYHPLYLYRHQVCKQADTILAHCLFGDEVPKEVMLKSYQYYEKVTTHDSSLSPCIFSLMAARLGMVEKAYRYYETTVRTDIDNTHGNTKDGIHTANMGGAYLALVAGFAGLRLRSDGPHFHFCLPAQWRGYRFYIWYRGSRIGVQVTRKKAQLTLMQGPDVTLFVGSKAYELADELTLEGVVQ